MTTNGSEIGKVFTVTQIAERMHVHVQTVRNWIRSGELGYIQVGKYRHVTDDQLAAFIDRRRVDA